MNINYRQLLQRHQDIRVPMIQRDYAQGRPQQAEVREAFLGALQAALERTPDPAVLPLNLDFIYGSVEPGLNYFSPLDGQQRLTTLFLLHWFLAWQDGSWDEFTALFRNPTGRCRFTYKVRESSNEFFDALVNYRPAVEPSQVPSLRGLLTDQRWYFRSWRLDPTVQSALGMLDAIHRRFQGSSGLFARLVDDIHPAITFQLLDLAHFGLSDDLYIKMNARGKPLTVFENFKARYEQVLASQFHGQTRAIGGREHSVKDFVALRLDTAWADFFWVHRDRQTHSYDDAVVNLFRVLALITRHPDNSRYLEDAAVLRNEKRLAAYTDFTAGGWLDEEFTACLISLLEPWSASTVDGAWKGLLPDARYFNEAAIFEKLAHNALDLTLPEVAQFAAYVLFLRTYPEAHSADVLQEWMRVARNLTVNSDIERNAELQAVVRAIRALLPAAPDILAHLWQMESIPEELKGFREQQLREESLKAGLIRAHAGWRPLIERAENHSYFRGQVEFLCAFSGVFVAFRDRDAAWNDATHRWFQDAFAENLTKAEAMFPEETRGIQPLEDFRWERALLTRGDYFLHTGQKTVENWSFLVNSPAEPASWKRLLRAGNDETAAKREFLGRLWKDLVLTRPLTEQLGEFIANASGLEPWIGELVRTPEALRYCRKHILRWGWEANPSIYLLSQSQTNFRRAELFSYCLDVHTLQRLHADGRLRPFTPGNYQDPAGQDNQPHALLHFPYRGSVLDFTIEYRADHFYTSVAEPALGPFPELRSLLYEHAGFVGGDNHDERARKRSSRPKIEGDLVKLAGLLGTLVDNPPV